MTLEELRNKWCPKCEENIKILKEFARENGGFLLNKIYSDLIIFECSRKHTWSVCHKKYFSNFTFSLFLFKILVQNANGVPNV